MMAVREGGRGGFSDIRIALMMVMVMMVTHKHFTRGQTVVVVESVERSRSSCPAGHFGSDRIASASAAAAAGFHSIPTGFAKGPR